ncbi:MAG: ATP-binding protein [Alphaproteobacteria bacterium]|nr:ATP-binding protein [Alphaproteobacteria bacterium]
MAKATADLSMRLEEVSSTNRSLTAEIDRHRRLGDIGRDLHPVKTFSDRLGRIVAVSGSQAIMLLDDDLDRDEGDQPTPLQIGSLVKMGTPYTTVYGIVSGLSIPVPSTDPNNETYRIVELELLGETSVGLGNRDSTFQRGVSYFPSLADNVFATTADDLANVYTFPTKSAVPIGSIHQDRTIPAYVVTDDLLGKHFAILGTTGAGKSCAVALILRAILSEHPNGHVLLLDVHNEYSKALGDAAEVLDPGTLQIPYWLLNSEEIEEIVINSDGQDAEVEAAILNEVIVAAKRQFVGDGKNAGRITVDAPVPYRLGEVARILDETAGRLDRPRDVAPYMRLKARFAALQADPRFDFMFPGLSVRDNMAQIISQLFRIPVAGKPVTIVDLSGVPSEIINVVVSVLCRMTFDFALWSERSMPMLLVCEEAHRYAPTDSGRGFEPTKRALSQIAKEGRKYGVSLCLVSQRPSELAAEILSQCNTVFALRMSNQKDQDFVRSAMSESAIGLMDFLPSLRNAEAIAVGEGVSVPMRVCFDELPNDERPMSGTASFSSGWSQDIEVERFVERVIERWRHRQR